MYIDKEEGINLEDCEKVSNEINEILDKADYIDKQYFLEVSSPGIERILRKDKHLKDNIGSEIQINLFKPVNERKQINGILKGFTENNIVIKCKDREIILERNNISLIKLKYDW